MKKRKARQIKRYSMDRKKTQCYKGVSSPKWFMDRVLFVCVCVCEIFLADSKMYLKEQRRLIFYVMWSGKAFLGDDCEE